MKTAELGDILEYKGKLVKVIGIATGKMIIMAPIEINKKPCFKCNNFNNEVNYVLENCPNFQDGATPIKTIKT